MKAMVLTAFNAPLELQDLPMPEPGARDALVRVHACGSGLTLHHSVTGNLPTNLPIVLGHEVVGEVVETGNHAEGLDVGDLVTLHALLYCGMCRFCRTGREPLCVTGPPMVGRQVNGGYAEYMVAPDRAWLKLPAGLMDVCAPAEASIICDAVVTPYKAARRAGLSAGETCVVYGAAGGVGIHQIQVAKMRGARVIGIDRGADKVAAVAAEGADDVIDAGETDVTDEIMRLTDGLGADVVVDFVGSSETLANAVAGLGRAGRIVMVGVSRASEARVDAPATQLVRAEQSILGSRAFSRQEIAECLGLVASGRLRPVVNHVFPLEQANAAHELVGNGGNIGRVVLTNG